jgi:hypothetical protein
VAVNLPTIEINNKDIVDYLTNQMTIISGCGPSYDPDHSIFLYDHNSQIVGVVKLEKTD